MKHRLKIKDIVHEGKDTLTYYFEKPENFSWEAGANMHVGLLGFDEGTVPNKQWVRHMSIITLPEENRIGFTTRVPGSNSEFKRKLSELNTGEELIIFKIGTRMTLSRSKRPVVLISMGVGIAAMRAMIITYTKNKSDIPMLINVNVDSSGFLYRNELDKLADESYKNFWFNTRQEFNKEIEELIKIPNAIYYIVGSDAFITENVQRLQSVKVSREDIITDKKKEFMDSIFAYDL